MCRAASTLPAHSLSLLHRNDGESSYRRCCAEVKLNLFTFVRSSLPSKWFVSPSAIHFMIHARWKSFCEEVRLICSHTHAIRFFPCITERGRQKSLSKRIWIPWNFLRHSAELSRLPFSIIIMKYSTGNRFLLSWSISYLLYTLSYVQHTLTYSLSIHLLSSSLRWRNLAQNRIWSN